MDSAPEDHPVSARVLATWLSTSRAYVSELEGKRILARIKGRFPLKSSVIAYIEHLRKQRDQEQSPRSAAAAEHHRQKARLAALQIARFERQLITMEEHNAIMDITMGLYHSSLGQLPAIMAGSDLAARRKWEHFARETGKALADKALQLAEEAERSDRCRGA